MLLVVLHDRDSLTPVKWILIDIVRSVIDISTHNSLIWFIKFGRLRWSIILLQHFKENFVWFVNGKLTRGLSKSHRDGLHFREDKWQKIKEGKGPFVVWTFRIQKKIQIYPGTSLEMTAQKTNFSWKCVNFLEKFTIKRLYKLSPVFLSPSLFLQMYQSEEYAEGDAMGWGGEGVMIGRKTQRWRHNQ